MCAIQWLSSLFDCTVNLLKLLFLSFLLHVISFKYVCLNVVDLSGIVWKVMIAVTE